MRPRTHLCPDFWSKTSKCATEGQERLMGTPWVRGSCCRRRWSLDPHGSSLDRTTSHLCSRPHFPEHPRWSFQLLQNCFPHMVASCTSTIVEPQRVVTWLGHGPSEIRFATPLASTLAWPFGTCSLTRNTRGTRRRRHTRGSAHKHQKVKTLVPLAVQLQDRQAHAPARPPRPPTTNTLMGFGRFVF